MSNTPQNPMPPAAMVLRAENMMDKVYQRHTSCPKSQLKLSIGDPTFDGNLITADAATESLRSHTHEPKVLGYQRAWGAPAACEAVAKYWNEHFTGGKAVCRAEDVVLTCGASEALLHTCTALCDAGDNILIPSPGFGQYTFLCDLFQFEKRYYSLDPDNNWEMNLEQVRGLVDDKTRAILITNPSNPCGSNFSRQHVEDILKLAEELKVPVIADEIYAGMVFDGEEFTSVAAIDTCVPRFIVGGTAKSFMAPGWRVGWAILVDPQGYAACILEGMHNLAMMALGPNALTQKALPEILGKTPASFMAKNMKEIEQNAHFFAKEVGKCHGLSCQRPQGALYIMVKIDFDQFKDFATDVEFYQALEDEENVQVIPGTYMFMPGFFRVCITRPIAVLEEVMPRLASFCDRHKKDL